MLRAFVRLFFFFNDPATTEIYPLSLHDALPISYVLDDLRRCVKKIGYFTIHTGAAQKKLADGRNAHLIQEGEMWWRHRRSEEHTSELQSQSNLVCRLLLQKKKIR